MTYRKLLLISPRAYKFIVGLISQVACDWNRKLQQVSVIAVLSKIVCSPFIVFLSFKTRHLYIMVAFFFSILVKQKH